MNGRMQNCGLYLGYSRSARPLRGGFTGHVADPGRSIANFEIGRLADD
jgi:hypothetical protein